ncbi:MAG: FkbM family methyltransferase [Pseudomonadales bacterium]
MKFPLEGTVHLLDIGARYGLQEPWQRWHEQITPVLVEPEEAEYRRLKARYEHVFNVALADAEGTRPLYIAEGAGKSSLYRPNMAFLGQFPKPERFRTVATQDVVTTTLDTLYARGELPRIDAVKVDVQGAELDILRGGQRLLSDQLLALQVEICFDELYEGYPHFCAVDGFVRGLGLHLHDLSKRHWRYARGADLDAKGRLIFGDALYFASLERILSLPEPEDSVLRAAFIAMIYGFADYSMHLLEASELQSGAITAARDYLQRHCRRRLAIPSRAMRRALKALAAFFPPVSEDGSVGAKRLFGRFYW